jgi:hypothetical protein
LTARVRIGKLYLQVDADILFLISDDPAAKPLESSCRYSLSERSNLL